MLVDLTDIAEILVCPVTKRSVTQSDSRSVNGKPVLIDFQNSILDQGSLFARAGASPIRRGNLVSLVECMRRIIAPNPAITKKNVARFLEAARQHCAKPRILIIGGGTIGQGTEILYSAADVEVVAFDVYDSPTVQFLADAHNIPLRDKCVDGVLIQAVLEHVLDPAAVVFEIARVLRDEGVVYAETPFLQQVHEGAFDFTRFTESGHRWLFRQFSCIDSGVVLGIGVQMIWSIDYLFRAIFRSRRAGYVGRAAFFWLRYVDIVIPEQFRIDDACGVYFFGRLADKALRPSEMRAYYRGAN